MCMFLKANLTAYLNMRNMPNKIAYKVLIYKPDIYFSSSGRRSMML